MQARSVVQGATGATLREITDRDREPRDPKSSRSRDLEPSDVLSPRRGA
ncbi:MAG TPA: hypothetical protein VGD37_09595 [Kofleriaceae bacterium]|jgi:hypothetical protein